MQPSFQNEDALLNKVQLKRPSAASPATINTSTQHVEESTCPASPPPEVQDDSLEQPIVIPTERRCSPILLKEKVKQLKKLSQTQTVKDSQHTSTHSIQDTSFSHGKYDNNRTASAPHTQHHHNQHHHNRSYYDNRSSSQQLSHSHSSTPLHKEKPTATTSKLQTVKVVITEPLPDHVKQQHFPSTSKYVPHTSVCYNNLKTLPQVSQEQDNEAYNPEELWQQYNESRNNSLKQTHSTSPVFKRLGSKVPETSPIAKEVKIPEISTLSKEAATTSTSKPLGRYTPIPDVLKSPPLSVNDINNLLLESGADKNDISAIGTRRPPKQETDLPNSPTNSFELSRKKLADSFKINSSVIENSKQRDDQDCTLEGKTKSSTNLPNERVALKYNPHPRQERLQSLSSTDGSECSTQSKISDPRIKHNVITSPLPQTSLVNVNVLPAINFNDPRLKKQNFPNLTNAPTNVRPQNMLPAPSSTPVMGYGQYQQQNSSNCMGRQDPRIAKQQNNIPTRRTSITQPHYSSEENWDSDDQDKSKMWNKSDPRLDNRMESRAESRYDNRFVNRARSCTPKTDNRPRSCIPKPANSVNKSFSNTIAADVRDNSETNKKSMKKYKKETKSKIEPSIAMPNPPKSDTEEDWDSEPEGGKNKSKPTATISCESLPKPVPETLPSTNNFDSNAQPIPTLNPLESAVKSTHPALQNYKTLLNYVTPPVHTTGLPPSKTYKPPTGNVNLSSNSYRPPIASHPAPVISPSTSYRPVPTATHLPPQHTIPITGHNLSIPLQHPPANNHFNAGSFYERNEKFMYYESKTPTLRCESQPRTYKEFREAKERALAQEAAFRRAAEAKREEEEEALNEKEKGKEKLEEAQQIKDKQAPKDELNKKINEKKANTGDNNKTNNENKDKLKQKDKPNNVPAESTLDKMYRTQNFATQFPKASSSFKIPKKKTEEKPKEETKPTELAKPKSIERNNKTNKEPLNELENSKDEQKTTNESNVKSKENLSENTKDKLHSRDPRCRAKTVQKTILDKENNKDTENKKQEDEVKEKNKESTKQLEQDLMKETEKKRSDENASENDDSKTSTNPESTASIPPNLGDIIVTSSDNQITLKPQQNLDKFIRLAQELSPKPQRILRRRNTMVVFDSAPLVDKEKLKKANAKLFEDVQDEERKRKKDEESRIARRNKNLEEMFKKTDDNCTVSTQNIIEGKRRTRPNMNFNETANVSKLFKHKTIKDTNAIQSPTATDAVSASTSAKPTKSNFKIKLAKIDMKPAEQQNDEEIESNEFKNKPKTVIAKSKATIAKEIQDESDEKFEEDEPASEEENSTKTKKVGPKSKTRKVNKKLEDEEEESNSDEEQQKTIKLKKTKAKTKTAKTNKKQEETEEDSTDDDEHNKTKKSLKSKVSKTNKKLEDFEEESLKNEQNSEDEAKGTKAKKSGKNKITKGNKKPQASEESEESGEEIISKESKQTKVNKSKKIKPTKSSKIQDDTEEETEYGKDEKSASKENKVTKVKTKKTTKNLEDSNGEDNGKESDTKQQNKTKVVKRNACKIQNKSQLESTEEKEEENVQERDKEAKGTTLTKTKPTETNACKESKANEDNSSEMSASLPSNNDADFKPNTSDNEHQHCAVSSTSTDNTPEEYADETPTTSSAEKTVSTKKEIDDNEPSSTASKSLNATPTPEANVDVLNEIVEILINNSDRERVLGLFGVIGEEKLKLIKSILELNKQQKETNEEPTEIKQEKQKTTETVGNAKQNDNNKEINEAEDEEEDEDDKPLKSLKTPAEGRAKKQSNTHKKKRTELDRLNEDIREMFICEGVLTATGRRMCTIIGEKAEAVKKSPEQTEQSNKRKSTSTRNIRRSLRGGTKAQDETEEDDDISLSTRNSEVSLDDVEKTSSAENSPQRKMPVLKPHTPIKIPEEVSTKVTKTKETNKRKSDDKLALKNKKAKLAKDGTESEDKDSDTEAENEDDKTQEEGTKPITTLVPIKNTNVHWHYQSKFLTWCMICEKRLSAKTIAVHFKTHHGENYISRLAPVILQQFKQGKRNRPLFGVDKGQQRNSWFYRCPFCLQYFNTPLMLWLEHFLNHTVEFRYECSKCHRSNNRKQTVQRHIRYCEGSTILTSAVKLTVPTEIKAHVCHLCNFIQLKRPNLERHYMEQHQIDKKTVELSGYTIILFDVANVECVPEDKAAEREKQAWEFIKKNEQVIDIPDDDDELDASTNVTDSLYKSQEIDHMECSDNNTEKEIELEKEKNDSKAKQNKDSNKDSKSKDGDVFLHNEVIPKANITTAKKSKNSEVQLHKKQVTKKDSILQNEIVVEKSQSDSENSSKKQSKFSAADSIKKLSENIVENQEVVTIPKELASQKKQEKTDLKHTKEAGIETQEPTKSKALDSVKSVLNKDSGQSKDIEQIKAVPSKDYERGKESEQSKEKSYKADSLEKDQNSSKETLENSNEMLLSNEITCKDVNTAQNDSSEEQFTLVYVSDAEDHAAVNIDCEVINEIDAQQHIQDELLSLAELASDSEHERPNEQIIQDELLTLAAEAAEKVQEKVVENKTPSTEEVQAPTSMSDIISSSIDFIYKRDSSAKRKFLNEDASEAKKPCPNQSNVFFTTHEETSSSPTRQILAQSMINIEDSSDKTATSIPKPLTMAERLSQRFKDLNADNKSPKLAEPAPKENAFKKLINDTLKELEMEKDSISKHSANEATPSVSPAPSCSSMSSAFSQDKANVFDKNKKPLNDLVKEQNMPKDAAINQSKLLEKSLTMPNTVDKPKESLAGQNKNTPTPTQEIITVISDDEDWEDIEITETAPAVPISSTGNINKSKNKGLFQKFGLFKGNKNKKHLTPLAFMPKKKNKDKTPITSNSNTTTNTTPVASPSNSKPNITSSTANNTNSINTACSIVPTATSVTSTRSATNSPFAHLRHNLGFKPVINIMDDLLPDSPCNDPIDLVPELAPLEPLQDLNDISSILDSNLSAVNINVNNNQTSIEEALDFVNEQQQQQIQDVQVLTTSQNSSSNCSSTNTSTLTSTKSVVNSIFHVGFSRQLCGENSFKFYCLLENCSFLFSSDAVGLETHFMMEHSQIKWNGYCYMCQAQCVNECTEGLSITKEIKHMMDKHANNTGIEITNNDSNSCSTVVEEDRPKIKLRRLTGDCLSRSTPEITPTTSTPSTTQPNVLETDVTASKTKPSLGSLMLGALLEAKPKPPTIDMPPQPEMPLTEPLLLNSKKSVNKKPQTTKTPSSSTDGKTVSWIRVGDVTALLDHSLPLHVNAVKNTPTPTPPPPLQIASVVSLNPDSNPSTSTADPLPVPKISNMRSITPKIGNLLPQQTEKQHMDESASESFEVSRILANANNTSATIATDLARKEDDSPVIVAETVPIAQNKTGDFVITQTLSAEYSDSSSAHLGFNINIAATATGTTTQDSVKKNTSSTSATVTSSTSSSAAVTPSSGRVTSRQYKCMAAGCKFVSRVPVAMSDHLRFHERRNFSNKRDYFSCGFCFYTATDVEDYMKHADQYHIISKTGAPPPGLSNSSETDTATSLTKKILNILNSSGNNSDSSSTNTTSSVSAIPSKHMSMPTITPQVQDTEEVYLKKLRDTIDEIVGPTGLADDKLYRCVIKNCQSRLTESTFLSHIMYHINTSGQNAQHYTYKCPHCSAQYNRASGIKVHIKNHARNRYFCYLCEQTTANPGQLLKHFSEKHWHTIQMHTKLLLKPKLATDGSNQVLDSGYYVVYTQDLSDEEVRKFGEKLILDWQRKKAGSKTHFKSSEIDLLPMTAIFTRDINCGECEYKTKVRTNMYRHLQMHKQNPGLANKTGVAKVYSVDPVNPVPCLNSSERFFDKMTNLASSSLIPNTSNAPASANSKSNYKIPYAFVEPTKRLTCHLKDCNYQSISEELFRSHMTTLHSNTLVYRCGFCQEEICKRGITTDRIFNHLRFHGACIYRCEECNYLHPLRYVVERHINEKHSKMKVNIVKHERTIEDNMEGMTTLWPFAGKKYKESTEPAQASATRALNSENTTQKVSAAPSTSTSSKGKGKWICDECGQKAASVTQIQTHCQQQHGVKNQYKCVHCTFGSQQLSLILSHIDGQHSGMVREARTMYHREESGKEKIADTRPLWQRNDPTRVRHIRGILMEDEEESLNITEDDLADDNEMGDNEELEIEIEVEEGDEVLNGANYLIGYEFACFHCDYKAQTFDELKEQHYKQQHNNIEDKAKPFWYHLLRKFCCPECRAFVGIYKELERHLKTQHGKNRFYGADVTTMESADNTLRLLCGYCPVHCANADDLLKHQLRLQHAPQDVRIDNDQQIMDILNLGHAEVAYQCTLCTDIFPNRVAIVDHACNTHAGEESFSFRELSNSLIYRCHMCCFTSTTELDLMRHMIDHYTRFKSCKFCDSLQTSFTVYMQHCYAQHKNVIHKFKTLYPVLEIRNFLLHMLVVFPSGLVLNKRNLLNTKYGKTEVIDELYEEMYKISQEPPIPRLSIARLVARKSIEAQHKHVDVAKKQDDILDAMQTKPKPISKRRRTLVVTLDENKTASGCSNTMLKPKLNVIENKPTVRINKRRTTVDQHEQKQPDELSAPLQMAKISKRRRTVAVDRDTLFSSNLSSNSYTNLLMEKQCKKRKYSIEMSEGKINYTFNLDMEPFSFYGQKPEPIDLSKIYTKIAIGGINTPLTIDKFKLLFNIECQLKLTKCDEETNTELTNYNQYKHIKKACPASHKIRYK